MAFEQKENTGALFTNERKQKPSDPDRTGTINIDGVEYRLSGWLNETKAGQKYMKLSIRPKEQQGRAPARRQDDADDTW